MRIQPLTTITPVLDAVARDYLMQRLRHAQTETATALTHMRTRPAIIQPGRAALDACYEAVEHLHDALQVDAPTEMLTGVRHALQELYTMIDALDRPRPGMNPPAADPLERTITLLDRLERQLLAT